MRTLFRSIIFVLSLFVTIGQLEARTLVIGSVAKDTKEEIKEFEPLAIYLENHLAAMGIDRVEIKVVPTADIAADEIKNGTIDIYIESPLVAARVAEKSGCLPLLRRWKKGVADYWGEIIVLSGSAVKRPADLRGRVLAFEDPDSTSGHLLQRAFLLGQGLQMEELSSETLTPASSKIGTVFTSGDKTSVLLLLAGRVDAIATDPSYVKMIEAEQPGTVRSIARTISVPRHVVMRGPQLSESEAELLAEVLIAMSDNPEGQQVLKKFGKTTRFDRFPNGVAETFKLIHEQLRLLENE